MKSAFFQGFSLKKAIAIGLYRISRLVCLGIARLAFRLRIEGEEHIPLTGGAILAVNHVSYMDPVIVGVSVRRHVHFMAKEELFRFRPFGWLLRQYGVFPIQRGRRDPQAMKWAISLLQQGNIVAIFPEGTRGDGVRLGPAKPGIGLIAARSRAPVIPTLHHGTQRALPRGAWFPKPHPISIRFGAPLRFAEAQTGEGPEQIVAFSQTIMERIAALNARSEGGEITKGDRACVSGEAMPTETRKGEKQRG